MERIERYFLDISEKQKEQFSQLGELYHFWNSQINVISRKDMEHFYEHHVLHSLSIAKLISFKAFTEILDAGTGGGFPGIPLSILFPKVKFTLVDSIGKKIKVVKEVVAALGLENVEAEQIRMEQMDRSFDFVVSRAVTDLETFVRWTMYRIHSQSFNKLPNGIIYLKGMNIDDEINRVKKMKKAKVKCYPIDKIFREEYFSGKQIVYIHKG